MKFWWHFFVWFIRKVDKIVFLLENIYREKRNMGIEIDELVGAVQNEHRIIDNAITMIRGFNTQLNNLNNRLDQVIAELELAKADTRELNGLKQQIINLRLEIENKTIELEDAINNSSPLP